MRCDASRSMRAPPRVRPHPSRRAHARSSFADLPACALLVLARTAIVRPFREERPGPGGRLDRAAGRRIGCSRAARAAAEQDRDRFFIGPGWLKEPRVRITRKGSTKMSKDTTVCAGIDTGKHKLDVAIDGGAERAQVDNNSEGHRSLLAWLRQREVEGIGIEASGGYEQAVVSSLRADGFVVIIFQPVQVRAYARFVLQHAKNDTIDAVLYRVPEIVTLGRLPGEGESDSRWRTKEVRHVGSDTLTPGV